MILIEQRLTTRYSERLSPSLSLNVIEPHIEFDPKKPFYAIVVTYAAQVHGLLDLSARGMRNLFTKAVNNLQHDSEVANERIKKFCEGIKDGYEEHV